MGPQERVRIPLADGRTLEALVSGPEDGTPFVFHHGSPGAALRFPALVAETAERGLRLVTYSRPGFGGSTRHEGRRVADCIGDVAALADHLGAERFLTAGWSGGGPHALACAALLPERVLGAATIAGVAPYEAEELDWTEGMGEDNRVEYPTAARDPEELLRWMRPQVETLSAISAGEVVRALRSVISDVDEASLTTELGEVLARSFHDAFANGPWGWYDDDLAFVSPWGFDLSSIRVPVTIWQGQHDLMVPFAHGRWLAKHVAGARAELRPEHGHLSLAADSLGEILDDLVAHARV